MQKDMFSGEFVDRRTASQKKADKERNDWKQMEMFSQRDLAQFGVSAHPVMDVSPGRLVLISEDPRTPEEKERDLRRAAEAKTRPMFADTPTENSEVALAEQAPAERLKESELPMPTLTRESVYMKLVETVREETAKLWVDKLNVRLHSSQLPIAMLQAAPQLEPEEINVAVQIGEFLGKQEVETNSPEVQSQGLIEQGVVEVAEIPKVQTPPALDKMGKGEPSVEQDAPINPKTAAYIELVEAMHEQVSTIWIAEEYRKPFLSLLPLTIFRATEAGLTASEIAEALHVGKHLIHLREAKQDEITPIAVSSILPLQVNQRISIPVYIAEQSNENSYGIERGYRRQARMQSVSLRKRK
jgi:hypothetical protein